MGRELDRKSRRYALGSTVALVTALGLAGSFLPLDAAPLEAAPRQVVLVMRSVPPESPPPAREVPPPPVETLFSEQPSPETVPVPPQVEPVPVVKEPEPLAEPPKPERPKPSEPPKPRKPKPPRQPVAEAPQTPAERAEDSVPAVPGAPTASPAPAHASPDVRRDDRKEQVLATLMEAIGRYKKYPRQGRRLGLEGPTYLLVSIGSDGTVTACALSKPGAHPLLDKATAQLGERLVGLSTPGRGAPFRILVPVHYSLTDR